MKLAICVLLASASLSGCAFLKDATTYHPQEKPAPPETMTAEEAAVRVLKSDPPDGYTDVGTITSSDGQGCGIFEGSTGNLDRVMMKFKKAAAAKGANYVQLLSITEPNKSANCNEYVLTGIAYKKP